jgi:hypothetical protein
VGYSPDGKDVVSRGHVRIRYQEVTSEGIENFMHAAVAVIFRACNSVRLFIVACSYKLCV